MALRTWPYIHMHRHLTCPCDDIRRRPACRGAHASPYCCSSMCQAMHQHIDGEKDTRKLGGDEYF